MRSRSSHSFPIMLGDEALKRLSTRKPSLRQRQHFLISLAACALLASMYTVQADVYLLSETYALEPQLDMPAGFGPGFEDEGVEGLIVLADPPDACVPLLNKRFGTPWIALISRDQRKYSSNCTFDAKVRNAQNAGALAAIVYDDMYESLIIMSKPPNHADPLIPSCFITLRSGMLIRRLLELDFEARARIVPDTSSTIVSLLMTAFLALLAMLIVLTSLFVMRSWALWLSYQPGAQTGPAGAGGAAAMAAAMAAVRDSGLSPRALRALPVLIFEKTGDRSASQPLSPSMTGACSDDDSDSDSEGLPASRRVQRVSFSDAEAGDGAAQASCEKAGSCGSSECEPAVPGAHAGETKRMCAVCLESYSEGDKVRVLPCLHRFHMDCVDQWLSARKACPVCKWDSSRPMQAPAAQSTAAALAAARNGRGLNVLSLIMSTLQRFMGPPETTTAPSLRTPLLSRPTPRPADIEAPTQTSVPSLPSAGSSRSANSTTGRASEHAARARDTTAAAADGSAVSAQMLQQTSGDDSSSSSHPARAIRSSGNEVVPGHVSNLLEIRIQRDQALEQQTDPGSQPVQFRQEQPGQTSSTDNASSTSQEITAVVGDPLPRVQRTGRSARTSGHRNSRNQHRGRDAIGNEAASAAPSTTFPSTM